MDLSAQDGGSNKTPERNILNNSFFYSFFYLKKFIIGIAIIPQTTK